MIELVDIPKPYRRLYDDKRRHRGLCVRVCTWRGTSPGAKHWYAHVKECDNPILWDDTHYYFSEDTEGIGREFGGLLETSFSTFDAALDWVLEIIRVHFTKQPVLEVHGGCITPQQLKQELRERQ